jgi:hypothetical protein
VVKRINLHDTLKRTRFDHAVICTFTFEPQFFEGYCLDRFKALDENNNIAVVIDRGIHDALLDCPASEWPRLANVRYLLHPIRVPGVFHPKVSLFVTKQKGLLIIGSANFTRAGLTANAELVGAYEIDVEKTPQHLPLFQQATDFLLALAGRWPNPDLDSSLRAMTDDAAWLVGNGAPHDNTAVRFAHNLDEPLWSQVCRDISAPVDEFHALSRFFDAEPKLLHSVDSSLKPKRTILWTQSGVTTMTPAWFGHSGIRTKRVTVRDCSIADDDHEQPLHAKALAIVNKRVVRLGFGSANFSSAGLLSTAATGNIETMVIVESVSAKLCDPNRLFDPCGNAKPLTSVADLVTVEPEQLPRPRDGTLLLSYAGLSDKRLKCVWSSESTVPSDMPIHAVLTFGDGGEDRVLLHRQGESFVTDLEDRQVRRCTEGATVIWVEALVKNGPSLRSNQLFVTNLQDIETGRGQRRERRIREAQKSAVQFASVLQELMELPDSEQLQNFLTYCDIPVIDAPRPLWARGARPPWQDSTAIRSLGQRNLRAYASLHQAAMGFCARHIKRLRRHCERVSLAGVPNFFHIALAIANVVRGQVERLLTGLEMTTQPLSVDEWHEHRQRLAEYFGSFREVMEVIDREYLPVLQKRFKAALVRDALEPDLRPLGDVCEALRQVKRRIESCRTTNLRVMLPTGGVTTPGVFKHDVVHEARWSDWEATVRTAFERANAAARIA